MQYLLFMIVSIMLLVSCGPEQINNRKNEFNIDGRVEEYFYEFKTFLEKNDSCCGSLYSIKMEVNVVDSFTESKVGECVIWSNNSLKVINVLNPNNFTHLQNLNLMFHEGLHCLKLMGHTEKKNQIMNPALHNEDTLQEHWEEMKMDLVNDLNMLK